MRAILSYSVLMVAMLLFETCAINPVSGKKEFMLVGKNQEIAMGQQSDPSIVASFGLYQDDKIQAFITEKGQQMAGVSHRSDLKYEFKVLDSPVVNAFALPGGYVYFTRGILAHFNNEAEFAGVLGHEIGHITARHSAKQYSQQIIAQVGLIAGVVLSEDFARYADLAQTGIGLMFLKFSRDHESESDRLGVEYSTKIGYDAFEMADFFSTLDRLSDQAGGSIPTFLSTHPDPADRHNKVEELAKGWQRKENKNSYKVGRNEYLKMIDGLIYGEDPRQGYVEGNTFYHPELKFRFPIPSGWQTANMPTQVQMAPEDGRALILLTLAQGDNLSEAANNMLQQYQFTLIGKQDERVNGRPALRVDAQQVDQQSQQAIRMMSYLIEYNGMIYQFMGLSYSQDFNAYESRFLQTMRGFDTLTDASKINVKPEHIAIKTIEKNTTLQDALKGYGVPSSRLEELAILNGMQLSDNLTKGMMIKVVE
ncbi:MAG TPA: M48 family metalloprotease [Saprospiraceae bacterium]|mgnify:CR=1 FL=1|nr:M48 family metalloprotease [Saprospiraceae bacterium]HMQ81762.1 M48 family metalloprotease [Saprospiraceae bacterium]